MEVIDAANRAAYRAAEAFDGVVEEEDGGGVGLLLARAEERGNQSLIARLRAQVGELRTRVDVLTAALRETEELRRSERRAVSLGQAMPLVPHGDAREALLRVVAGLDAEEEVSTREIYSAHGAGEGRGVDEELHGSVVAEVARLREGAIAMRAAISSLRAERDDALQEAALARKEAVKAVRGAEVALAAQRSAERARAESERALQQIVQPIPGVGDAVEVRPRAKSSGAASKARIGIVMRVHGEGDAEGDADGGEGSGRENAWRELGRSVPTSFDIQYPSGFVELGVGAGRVLLKVDPITRGRRGVEKTDDGSGEEGEKGMDVPFADEDFRSQRYHVSTPLPIPAIPASSLTSGNPAAVAAVGDVVRAIAESRWTSAFLQRRAAALSAENAALRMTLADLASATPPQPPTAPVQTSSKRPHTSKPKRRKAAKGKR